MSHVNFRLPYYINRLAGLPLSLLILSLNAQVLEFYISYGLFIAPHREKIKSIIISSQRADSKSILLSLSQLISFCREAHVQNALKPHQ